MDRGRRYETRARDGTKAIPFSHGSLPNCQSRSHFLAWVQPRVWRERWRWIGRRERVSIPLCFVNLYGRNETDDFQTLAAFEGGNLLSWPLHSLPGTIKACRPPTPFGLSTIQAQDFQGQHDWDPASVRSIRTVKGLLGSESIDSCANTGFRNFSAPEKETEEPARGEIATVLFQPRFSGASSIGRSASVWRSRRRSKSCLFEFRFSLCSASL